MPSPARYSIVQIALHWIVAAMVLYQIYLHDGIHQAWRARRQGADAIAAMNPHIVIGILVGLLVVWRLVLRLTRGTPALPDKEPPVFKWVAHITHWLFYALLLVIVGSGLGAWFGLIRPAAELHETLGEVLLYLIGLHVLGALVQHFYFKTDVLKRMLGRA